MDYEYNLNITPKALQYIREKLIPPKMSDRFGLVIYTISATGGCYEIHTSLLSNLQSISCYTLLFSKNYHNHGFDIFIEDLIIKEHSLPNPMVLDLRTKLDGELMLDIKNPAFET